ncbi:hypothetical protein HY990_07265 [Candidatus Micrarchaeota archaeon]|nr:hypothetical protein [Candidatus Micrarchaeota archaeon]
MDSRKIRATLAIEGRINEGKVVKVRFGNRAANATEEPIIETTKLVEAVLRTAIIDGKFTEAHRIVADIRDQTNKGKKPNESILIILTGIVQNRFVRKMFDNPGEERAHELIREMVGQIFARHYRRDPQKIAELLNTRDRIIRVAAAAKYLEAAVAKKRPSQEELEEIGKVLRAISISAPLVSKALNSKKTDEREAAGVLIVEIISARMPF